MKSRKILSILIALAMLLSAAATAEDGNVADDGSATAPAAAPAAAPAETAGSIAGAWTIENLTYEAKALAGGFSIKGEFQGTYELTLNPDGSMSSQPPCWRTAGIPAAFLLSEQNPVQPHRLRRPPAGR